MCYCVLFVTSSTSAYISKIHLVCVKLGEQDKLGMRAICTGEPSDIAYGSSYNYGAVIVLALRFFVVVENISTLWACALIRSLWHREYFKTCYLVICKRF